MMKWVSKNCKRLAALAGGLMIGTMTVMGNDISVMETTVWADDTYVETKAAYDGISIDGSFSDWDAIARTNTDKEVLKQAAVVFDGDWLYIYMKEDEQKPQGNLTWSGPYSNGKFTILTDTGRDTVFKLYMNSIDGIKDAVVAYSNHQYEIAIPASAVKQYKESISFGYYMEEDMLITDIVNIQDKDNEEEKNFAGIQYDGFYSDWEYYPHELVQYSTPGGMGGDAEAALYSENAVLYGHVLSFLHRDEAQFQPFSIRINEKDNLMLNVRLVTVDEAGNINMNPQLRNLDAGTYEYYLWDLNSGSTVRNINEEGHAVYGKMYLTIRKDAEGNAISDEMEYQIDLKKLAKKLNMDASDMKVIQAQYINIGTKWITFAGTSSGAVMGISLCVAVTGAVLVYKKKKSKVA